jgi:23S rRNA (adenine-N6)-dimethyltransferase
MFAKRRRPPRSQNFLFNRQLVKNLVRQTSFGPKDTVLEIGPGRGIITQELLALCRQVMAVEVDPKLCFFLRKKFQNAPNLILFNHDFLHFPLPFTEYKVFSNPPFSIEGKVIRKFLTGVNPPREAHLVVRQEVGERWTGYQKESFFSVRFQPWFKMKVEHRFKKSDFFPQPKVEAVLIGLFKRKAPLLKETEKKMYEFFLQQGFGGGRRMEGNLKSLFSNQRLEKLSRSLGFSCQAKPSELSFSQWLALFKNWR